jgi:hypothetical protein
MLYDHEFFPQDHSYIVPGKTVISTSDIISLAGLSDFSSIPKAILENARYRGEQVDRAIKYYEMAIRDHGEEYAINYIYDQMEGDLAEIRLQFEAYRGWKHSVGFEPIFPIDQSLVYEVMGGRVYIGATPDLRGFMIQCGRRIPAVIDIKCTSRLYGMKLKEKKIAWGMQLESYLMASDMDDELQKIAPNWLIDAEKKILQLNPVFKETGYFQHDFDREDWDRYEWIGLALNAQSKIAAGILPEKR